MAYSKAKMKNNGDESSSRFRPFCKGTASDRLLPTYKKFMYSPILFPFISSIWRYRISDQWSITSKSTL